MKDGISAVLTTGQMGHWPGPPSCWGAPDWLHQFLGAPVLCSDCLWTLTHWSRYYQMYSISPLQAGSQVQSRSNVVRTQRIARVSTKNRSKVYPRSQVGILVDSVVLWSRRTSPVTIWRKSPPCQPRRQRHTRYLACWPFPSLFFTAFWGNIQGGPK